MRWSTASTNTRISATTSYNSGGIISPISRRDSVSASLSSRWIGTLLSCAFSIIFSARIPLPLATTRGASSEGSYSSAIACFTFFFSSSILLSSMFSNIHDFSVLRTLEIATYIRIPDYYNIHSYSELSQHTFVFRTIVLHTHVCLLLS